MITMGPAFLTDPLTPEARAGVVSVSGTVDNSKYALLAMTGGIESSGNTTIAVAMIERL
jgi:hypothetical protein